MAFLTMPIRNDIPAYREQVELEGTLFFFDFRYSERSERWYMDILDVDENIILAGIKMLINLPLIYRFVGENLPKGDFICIDESGNNNQPDRSNWAGDVILLYRESTT